MVKPIELLEQVRDCIRTRHLAYRTEKTYLYWIRRYLWFHEQKDPRELGADEVGAFLTSLAVKNKVSASTQNQALAAVLFLYREVLGMDCPGLRMSCAPSAQCTCPSFCREGSAIGARAVERHDLAGCVDALRNGHADQRVSAVAYQGRRPRSREIVIRDAKGQKDRVTMLPESLVPHVRGTLRKSRIAARNGSCGRQAWRLASLRPAAKVPECTDVLAVVVGVSRRRHFASIRIQASYVRHPSAPAERPAGGQAGLRAAGIEKSASYAYLPPFVRDPPARGRLRHPHGPGAARPLRREDDDDLHARPQQGWARRAQPARSGKISMTLAIEPAAHHVPERSDPAQRAQAGPRDRHRGRHLRLHSQGARRRRAAGARVAGRARQRPADVRRSRRSRAARSGRVSRPARSR